MKLPNADKAIVNIRKLVEYSLSTSHESGKHKARVFKSALNITAEDAEWLREQLLEAALHEEASEGTQSVFGKKYVIDFVVMRGSRSATVRSSWIIEFGTDFPRLTSCYVL